jgi:hypothetical protein
MADGITCELCGVPSVDRGVLRGSVSVVEDATRGSWRLVRSALASLGCLQVSGSRKIQFIWWTSGAGDEMNAKSLVLLSTIGILLLGGLVAVSVWLWSLSTSLDSGDHRGGLTDQFMQRKSDAASQIRDGVSSGSFRRAGRGVSELRRISEACNWFLPNDQYSALSDDFRNALNLLDVAVSRQNATELAEAYTQLIGSCTRCHQQATSSQIDLALKLPNGV